MHLLRSNKLTLKGLDLATQRHEGLFQREESVNGGIGSAFSLLNRCLNRCLHIFIPRHQLCGASSRRILPNRLLALIY
jgi:hypothetical protein